MKIPALDENRQKHDSCVDSVPYLCSLFPVSRSGVYHRAAEDVWHVWKDLVINLISHSTSSSLLGSMFTVSYSTQQLITERVEAPL